MSDRTKAAPGEPAEHDSGGPGRDEPPPPVSPWERAVAALGVALVLCVIGYMVHYALNVRTEMPEVTVEHMSTHAVQGGYVVRFRARNHGGATAAALQVEGELLRGSAVVETSGVTLDYVPSFSERRGGLFFRADPDRHEVRLVPKGYTDP